LHLTRFPSSSAGTFSCFPQLGHETSKVAGMISLEAGHKAD
jgi:hypothetical protein